jgi:ERCC4-type nuclease
MPLCRILENYNNAEGWQKGDVVDITHPWELIEEGKVALAQAKAVKEDTERYHPEYKPYEVEEIPIEKIPKISGPLLKVLKDNGMNTVEDIIEYGPENLKKIKGMGPKRVEFIEKFLR